MATRKNTKRKPSGRRDPKPKPKPKKRRKTSKIKRQTRISRIRISLVAALVGGLSAVGFWRCVDEPGGSPLDPLGKEEMPGKVDVGEGKTVDPTLLREDTLLRAELPGEEMEPSAESEQAVFDEAAERELEQRFPNYAVAYHFHTQIRSEPNAEARVVAYARRGGTFRVSEQLSDSGCAKGWYEIAPGGLFICAGSGVIVSDKTVTFAPSPPPPNLDAAMPYSYAYVVADDIPQYWRVPTATEEADVADLFQRIALRDKIANGEVDGGALSEDEAKPQFPMVAERLVGKDEQTTADGGATDPYALPPFVYQRMAKSFFVSIDDEVASEGTTYRRTVRGRFVPADRLAEAKPSTFEGLLLGNEISLPQVVVTGGGVKLLQQEEEGGPLKIGERVARLSRLPFLGMMKRRGRSYVRVGEKDFVSARAVAVMRNVTPPPNLKPDERWIDVDLSQQTLVAYEGAIPVFATLVSTGREGFETPTGSYRIYSKHIAITMDDPEAGEEAYSIEDVPWTQYFHESYAIHGAFWHNRFGRVRSHGCVNLSPADARRLFFWTGPHLPDGLHGMVASRENRGTRIVVH